MRENTPTSSAPASSAASPQPPASAGDPAPGDRLVRVGAAVFAVGAVATLVTLAPLLLGTDPFPTFMFWLSMLMGLGFLIAGAGLFRSIVAGRRQARAER